MGWTYDLKGMCNDPDRHELFTVVAAVHHERVGQSFNNGTLGFAESFRGITTCCVREVYCMADLDVVAEF